MMRNLRLVHHWLGLLLALPMVLQGLSGLVLVVAPEIDDWRAPSARSRGMSKPDIEIIAAAADIFPAPLLPRRYRPAVAAGAAAIIDLAQAGSRAAQGRVWVDPVSLEVLETQSDPDGFYRWAHALHEYLLIEGPAGRSIVGWCGIGLLLMALTGLPIWLPQRGHWGGAFTVSRRARGQRLQRELHGASAIGLAGMLLLQASSGISMAFPQTIRLLLGMPPPRQTGREASRPPPAEDPPILAAVLAQVRAAVPGATLVDLRLPNAPGRPAIAVLRSPVAEAAVLPILVTIAPDGSRVLATDDPSRRSAAASFLAWLRALHSAAGLGWVWRLLTILAGLVLPVLSITGVAMWWLRRRNRRRIAQQRRTAATGMPTA